MNTQLKPADIELPELPWAPDALEPVISKRTIEFHYGKHHRGYVDKLNRAIGGTALAGLPLEQLIRTASDDAELKGVFNNAAQVWNHTFYWDSLSPEKTSPSKALRSRIEEDFGSFDEFAKEFKKAAAGHFGSGWAWLVLQNGKLSVVTTPDAETPVAEGVICLLTLDVWEHAYYLDYQNDRGAYLDALIDRHLNWTHASKLFEQAES